MHRQIPPREPYIGEPSHRHVPPLKKLVSTPVPPRKPDRPLATLTGGPIPSGAFPTVSLSPKPHPAQIGLISPPQPPQVQGPLGALAQKIARMAQLPQDADALALLTLLCKKPGQLLVWHDIQVTQCISPAQQNIPLTPDRCSKLLKEAQDLLQRCCSDGQWTLLPSVMPAPGLQLAPGDLMIRYIRYYQ